MMRGFTIVVLSLIALAVVIAGCTGSNQQNSPTPTPAPTATLQPTGGPGAMGTIHSPQVQMDSFKIVQGAGRTGNYSIVLKNIGSDEARNVMVYLNAKDIKTLELQQDTTYRLHSPIPAYGNVTINIPTGLYNTETTSVILNIRIYWGDNDEFWNGENLTHILPWAPQPVNIP